MAQISGFWWGGLGGFLIYQSGRKNRRSMPGTALFESVLRKQDIRRETGTHPMDLSGFLAKFRSSFLVPSKAGFPKGAGCLQG